MRAIRSEGMKPEMLVRSLAHRLGYRFRLHRKDLPGKPDLTFPRLRAVIFVHGCFWHQHRKRTCADGRKPKSNTSYWVPKLKKNRIRDVKNMASLKLLGWKVLVIWECELHDFRRVTARILRLLETSPRLGDFLRHHDGRASSVPSSRNCQ
jgi:DNA mismatch endonuclease, patch repair protein